MGRASTGWLRVTMAAITLREMAVIVRETILKSFVLYVGDWIWEVSAKTVIWNRLWKDSGI
jgi:hypothetical protein